jgi:hypothetical protein
MKGVLIRSMANILGVNKEFKLWQAIIFYLSALGILAVVLVISAS